MKICKTLPLLALLVLSSCGSKTSTSEVISTSEEPSLSSEESTSSSLGKHYTDGRIVELVDDDPTEKTYWNEVYMNGGYPYAKGGAGLYSNEVADPHVVRGDDGLFYMYATNRVSLVSEDGCNWEVLSTSFINRPTWGDEYASNPAVWAPDLIKVQDQWILYYSLSAWGGPVGIGYATAEDAGGPWADQGCLFLGQDLLISNCIDPAVFIEDGEVYMTVGSFQGIYLVQLTNDGTALYFDEDATNKDGSAYETPEAYWKDNKVLIAGKEGGWDGSTYEGTYLVKRGEYYYLFGSVGTCCDGKNSTYQVWVGRSDNIMGPYRGKDGHAMTASGGGQTYGELVLWCGSNPDDLGVVGTGHNSILIDDAGNWWMYYHAYFNADNYRTRHMMMDKINWTDDNWPIVGSREDGNFKKPSYQVELDGPSILEE